MHTNPTEPEKSAGRLAAQPGALPMSDSGIASSRFGATDDTVIRDGERQSLSKAFASFSQTAASLEFAYQHLQADVVRLRQELAQTHHELARSQALAEIAALLAHEVRNPLGSLELYAGLLASADLKAEQALWVKQLQAGLRTLAATVNNVLHFHGPPPPGLVLTELEQVLGGVDDFLRPLAEQAGVQMQIRLAGGGMHVAADRHCLEQVLLNLGLNALAAMPQGGWLKISAWKATEAETNEIVVLEVADCGCGIAPENLGRIFQAGFSTRAGSPGLGLAVCRTIVEQHGGTITVRSSPGQGTTFRLRLPARKLL